MPSLPATDDGSARPLAEDLSNGPGDGEDITPGLGARLKAAGLGTGGRPSTSTNSSVTASGDDEGHAVGEGDGHAAGEGDGHAAGEGDGHAASQDAAAAAGESGRWFRPTTAVKSYVTIPPEEQGDGASADAGPGSGGDTEAAEAAEAAPGLAEAGAEVSAAPPSGESPEDTAPGKPTPEPEPEPMPEPEVVEALPGSAPGQADVSAPAWPADAIGPAKPTEVSAPAGPADAIGPTGTAGVWPARYRSAGWAASAVNRAGSAAGRMSALLRPGGPGSQARPNGLSEGGLGLASPPEGPVLASLPEGPVLVPEGPVLAGGERPGTGTDERPGERGTGISGRVSRRTLLQVGLIGGAGVAALPLLAVVDGITRTDQPPAGLAFSMNTNWRFGGQYTAGSESSSYHDGNFAAVTVPHTVVPLSWKDWDYTGWEQVWIYRRHFSGAPLLDPHRPGNRILVDFDGVMVNATVSVNDQVVATHQGGYLPFSAELTGKVTSGDNLLSVVVDSRCLPVPPVGAGRGPGSIDFFQPGGIYRDVRLRVLPQVFLADLFARPAGVL
ncbi:MAG TPA: hypothetical protein VMK84_32855, partial [Streptosporangiaceae bacterium]|nr:hypothetical protein [Streptosporangiaceae bacterium]